MCLSSSNNGTCSGKRPLDDAAGIGRYLGVEMNGPPLAWPAIGRPTCEPPTNFDFVVSTRCQDISSPVLPQERMKVVALLSNAAFGLAAILTPRLPGYLTRREISINASDYPAHHIEIPVSHGSGHSLRRRRSAWCELLGSRMPRHRAPGALVSERSSHGG